MPQTHSQLKSQRRPAVDEDDDSSAAGGSSSHHKIEVTRWPVQVDDDDSEDSAAGSSIAIEDHISQVQADAQKLKRRLKTLLRKNNNLKLELESKPASNETHCRSPLKNDLESRETRIRELEKTVKALKEENLKLKKRIEKYKTKQLRAEAEDLLVNNSDKKNHEMDPQYRMRKLLQTFSDLMLVTTLPDECPICFDKLELKKCSAFPCEHIVCNNCLPQISKGADETVQCPECRARHPRDDVGLVHMTETQRWDELLKIAQAWDAFDVNTRGELETSEEEAEENFLTDGDGITEDSSEVGRESERMVEDASSEPEVSTPPPEQRRAYSQSPTKMKRKMLEQLAEARDIKRRK